jgi:hypothetical protein
MSQTEVKIWRPLVYCTPKALRRARTLMGESTCPENVIARAITEGNVECGRRGKVWDPNGRWVALVERVPGRFRRRPRAWLVVAITRPRRTR